MTVAEEKKKTEASKEENKEAVKEESKKSTEKKDKKDKNCAKASKETKAEEKEAKEENAASEKKDKKDEMIEELSDKLKRQMAEFENFRKRSEKEKAQMFSAGARDVIEKILPVIDNFERGLAAVPEDEKTAFSDGMDKVYKQFTMTLEQMGVTPIETVGREFNPDFHNAVMHVEDDSFGENEIVEELQKGYMYQDTVVRHSMVKVAN